MSDSNVTKEILRGGVFLIVTASVVLAGWNEPLRYLFMTREEVVTEERIMFAPTVAARQSPFGWSPEGTALDRAPYRTYEGGYLEYSNNFDRRKMGTRTETERRENVQGRGAR